ncbi:DNA cytosine methyltransferase (plasmid) [Streptomyces cavourensis]
MPPFLSGPRPLHDDEHDLLRPRSAKEGERSTAVSPHGITTTHLFAGGCGDLRGFQEAGFAPQYAANHSAEAIGTVRMNFPGVRYNRCDINNLDFRRIPRTRVAVGSPICKETSPAGRNSTASQERDVEDGDAPAPAWSRTRATAWDLLRAAEVHDYDVVCGENVPDFATRWRPFSAWTSVWTPWATTGRSSPSTPPTSPATATAPRLSTGTVRCSSSPRRVCPCRT